MEQNNNNITEQVLMARLQEEMQKSINLHIQLVETTKELEDCKSQLDYKDK
ncbi:hypothetical protein [Staphylococcus arlettae]|uniref:hypothetical protein n=1 Tax=Staphylococcus arlettae TaxID=29378 RepID=UPI0021D354BE|nr:hypothetical protein [Staphylococcus arlettae]UXU53219.1 hypothetical protein MUA71_03835 [Staphylococcus arlettae]